MEYKESLTNEQIKKKFKNQFDIVSHAIKLAENMIKSGRGPRVKVDTQNPAMQILAEIMCGKDEFVDIPPAIVEHSHHDQRETNHRYSNDAGSHKTHGEKKKSSR